MKNILRILTMMLVMVSISFSQGNSTKPGKSNFLLRGYFHSGVLANDDEVTFEGGSFNPLFIYKQSDRLLFESELEVELEDGETVVNLEYANISYMVGNSMTVRVGQILVPFGIFMPNLHPAWINKFGSKPLGFGHDGIVPNRDIGVELRGGGHLGDIKMNYSVYLVNGPGLNLGEDEPEETGKLTFGQFPDNNKTKTFGGRLGVLPLSNSSLEIGLSGMTGKVGGEASEFESLNALLYAVDLSYVGDIPFLQSTVDVKAQYNAVDVDNRKFDKPSEDGEPAIPGFYDFDNKSTTYFAQLAIRPSLLENEVLRNFEVAARFSKFITPERSPWKIDRSQVEIGLNYWLDWRTVVKLTYKMVNNLEGVHAEEGQSNPQHSDNIIGNAILLHWAIGL